MFGVSNYFFYHGARGAASSFASPYAFICNNPYACFLVFNVFAFLSVIVILRVSAVAARSIVQHIISVAPIACTCDRAALRSSSFAGRAAGHRSGSFGLVLGRAAASKTVLKLLLCCCGILHSQLSRDHFGAQEHVSEVLFVLCKLDGGGNVQRYAPASLAHKEKGMITKGNEKYNNGQEYSS